MTQALTLAARQLVRRLVLVGTGPRGSEGMATLTPEAQRMFGASYAEPDRLCSTCTSPPRRARPPVPRF